MKDMILGVVQGACATREALRPFVETAHAAGCADKITLVSGDMPAAVRDTCGVHVLHVRDLDLNQDTVCAKRWQHYAAVLRLYKPDRVILTDVRDVIFQSDPFATWPFAYQSLSQLGFFFEQQVTLADCEYHKKWITDCYGRATYERISDAPIICAGVIIGGGNAVLQLVEKMIEALQPIEAFPGGMDQGILNRLTWDYEDPNSLTNFRFWPNRDGIVQTLARMTLDDLVFNEQQQILDSQERVVPIIHQYDRLPEVAERYSKTAPEWMGAWLQKQYPELTAEPET